MLGAFLWCRSTLMAVNSLTPALAFNIESWAEGGGGGRQRKLARRRRKRVPFPNLSFGEFLGWPELRVDPVSLSVDPYVISLLKSTHHAHLRRLSAQNDRLRNFVPRPRPRSEVRTVLMHCTSMWRDVCCSKIHGTASEFRPPRFYQSHDSGNVSVPVRQVFIDAAQHLVLRRGAKLFVFKGLTQVMCRALHSVTPRPWPASTGTGRPLRRLFATSPSSGAPPCLLW
jgi:hypothetical protein